MWAKLQALTGCNDVHDGIRQVAAFGVKELVITNGSKGSLIYADEQFYTIPAYTSGYMIDATGCGDTYMAGYLYQRIKRCRYTGVGSICSRHVRSQDHISRAVFRHRG